MIKKYSTLKYKIRSINYTPGRLPALLFLVFTLTLSSCSKDHVKNLSSDKHFLAFNIPDTLNPHLSQTITGTIEGPEIHMAIPQLTDRKELTATFEFEGIEVWVDDKLQESSVSINDFSKDVTYKIIAEDGSLKTYSVKFELVPELPHFYIDTEGEAKIKSKNNYIPANLKIDGREIFQDYNGKIGIRGRGNSTWKMPKKPYKIKLDSKASLFGLAPGKTWILLNEYIDGSMLYNSVPFKLGQLLDMPYTNQIIPVQITLNDEYQGFYAFTSHKEVKAGRIDIGKDGWLIELDKNFDEPLKFRSKRYKLYVMLQYPKAKDMTTKEGKKVLGEVRKDFEKLEDLIYAKSFPNNNYLDYLDDISFINYWIVSQLTRNLEINLPKSVYMHKKKGGKYNMGIIWDFDAAFGYAWGGRPHFALNTARGPLISKDRNDPGSKFFRRVMEDPYMRVLFRLRWAWFRNNLYEELREHVKSYALLVDQAYEKDQEKWGKRDSSGSLEKDLENLLTWLDARADYLDNLYQ